MVQTRKSYGTPSNYIPTSNKRRSLDSSSRLYPDLTEQISNARTEKTSEQQDENDFTDADLSFSSSHGSEESDVSCNEVNEKWKYWTVIGIVFIAIVVGALIKGSKVTVGKTTRGIGIINNFLD